MKTINTFFNKSPLWQVFIFGWLFTAGFSFLLFQFFPEVPGETELLRDPFVNLKIGASMGLLFGLMVVLMTSMGRKSQKFWDYSKEVQVLIDGAETQEQLQSIADNEFQTLMDLHQGHPHGTELTKLWAILKTKYKYAK